MKMRLATLSAFRLQQPDQRLTKKQQDKKTDRTELCSVSFALLIFQENRDAPSCVIRPQMDGRGHCDTEIFCPAG